MSSPMQPARLKRFYKNVAVAEQADGFAVLLDGKAVRTPARRPLVVSQRQVAEQVAAEWSAQGETIDPATMPATRIVHSAIDGVCDQIEAVRAEVVKYAASDLVSYRADGPDALVSAEAQAWDPLLDWCRDELGARFILAQGMTYVSQPQPALDAVAAAVERWTSPVDLAALHVMTTLTGSAIIALAVGMGGVSPEAGWNAAHVDEDYQQGLWGIDAEALARRDARKREFMAAARLISGA